MAALAIAACQNMAPADVVQSTRGQVVVALAIPGGLTISSVAWSVKSSSDQVIATGTINTSRAGATASIAVGVPAGNDDVVAMTATTTSGIPCNGASKPFNVTANQTSSASVALNCQPVTADGGLGSVVVTGTVVSGDNCPSLAAWTISPQTAAGSGGQVDVTATAMDADTGDTLTYAWSAGAGSFGTPTANTTTYTCAGAGPQTLHLAVSDNHAPIPCAIDVAFPPISCQ